MEICDFLVAVVVMLGKLPNQEQTHGIMSSVTEEALDEDLSLINRSSTLWHTLIVIIATF